MKQGLTNMPKIEVYTKFLCPYCSRAKALLTSKNVQFEEYDITMDGDLRAKMITRANGRTTVPQIFINDQHIGGSDELAALNHKGELDLLLEA
jgi:glutaredoxin 3